MQQSTSGSNKLGFWALMFSISGVTCLPVLGSIVGLVTGIIAVRREPRGLAIAAIVISTIGGCLVPLVAAPLLVLLPALERARSVAGRMKQGVDVGIVVDSFHTKKGRMPKDLAEAFGGESYVPLDEWGTALRMVFDPRPSGDDSGGQAGSPFINYMIESAGEDKQWGSADDVMLHQGMVFRNGSAPVGDETESDAASESASDDGMEGDEGAGSDEGSAGDEQGASGGGS